ncbi:excinuclease ABC subunit C [Candidatus Beckwithbacteria bacterium RBG_13_35_6]|uniref:Excinuclease ABC subunit C n=1 Tax=Candidatus Beckwithbacteria bacterium RBG_13_35_6 TaxID=1797456 RepID=A0A1F5DEH4_9BACT|nr:MAG: excinuclease ABC subunit C [Candidatus Beckwithbacteria bacterium RBG_13_35_6]
MYFVYILLSLKDNNLYIGFTSNLKQRLYQHAQGQVISTKYRKPIKLLYYEAFINKVDAKKRERFLKSGSGLRFLKKQLVNTLSCS